MDGDEDFDGELEGLDITACKDQIARLQADLERRREATERLQEKLKALNYELAARREEADATRRRYQDEMEQNKRRDEQQAIKDRTEGAIVPAGEDDYEQEKVRRYIEQHLNSAMPRRPETNSLGIRIFDERDLMVEKPPDMEKAEQLFVDTVLITHKRAASSEHTFHLSYRVSSKTTTAKKLREDACLYWGISEVEYILWTMSNAKVHDDLTIQNCFKPDEKAHLILAPKTPKQVGPPERIADAIRPKIGPKSRTVNKKKQQTQNMDVQQGSAHPDNFFEQMAKAPGLFEFMTQRDRRVDSHLKRIRPCSLCVYTLLLFATCLSIVWMKPDDNEYLCRQGVFASVTDAEDFTEIRDTDETWNWLTYSVPNQLFDNTSNLRANNYAMGWLRVTMRQSKPASGEACLQQDLPAGITCFREQYGELTAETADLEGVKAYWSGLDGVDGRSNTTVPWRFITEEQSWTDSVYAESGLFQTYIASGYAVDYNMQHQNLTAVYEAYVADMIALRNASWISSATRAVQVGFLVYNPNYDYWVSSVYLLEFPLNGIVTPNHHVGVFRRILHAGMVMGVEQLSLDIIRFALVVVILFYQVVMVEIRHERSNGGNGLAYILSSQGVADLGLICVNVTIFVQRYLHAVISLTKGLPLIENASAEYLGSIWVAELYKQNVVLEVFCLGLVSWRLFAFMKVNRHVFLIWNTLNVSLVKSARYLMVLVPVLTGCVIVAHAFWKTHSGDFRTFWGSATTILMILLGDDKAVRALGEVTRPGTIIFVQGFYLVIVAFLINSWAAVLIQEYQKQRVAAGFRPKEYAWSEYNYVQWLLPSPLKRAYCRLRPSIKPVEEDED